MKITAEARSDQWNADDFVGGPRVFTIAGVKPGKATAKYDIELVEGEGKVWRPPLTVLRILIAAWGDESDLWTGRRVELALDPDVVYGGKRVGGIRIKAMSDIARPFTLMLQKRRGEKTEHTIPPLPDTAPAQSRPVVTEEMVRACQDIDELRGMWGQASPDMQSLIRARVDELNTTTPDDPARDLSSPYETGAES